MSETTEQRLLWQQVESVVRITLNRPEKLNAMTREMYQQLGALLERAAGDPTVSAVVLTGEGRSFCAGYDLGQTPTPGGHRNLLETISGPVCRRLWDLPKPTIAAVHGYCLGGGCELAMACDLVVAAEDAVIGEPEIEYGICPDFLIIPWLTGPRVAKDLLLTGRRLTGSEAAQLGLVNRAVPPAELAPTVMAIAERIAGLPPLAVRLSKLAINRTFEVMGMAAALHQAEEISIANNLASAQDQSEFRRIARERGMRAALAWRAGQSGHATPTRAG